MANYTPEQQAAYKARGEQNNQFYKSALKDINLGTIFTNELGYTLWENDPSHKERKSTPNNKIYFKREASAGESFTDIVSVRLNDTNGEFYYSNLNNGTDKGNIHTLAKIRFGLDVKGGAELVKSWYTKYAGRVVEPAQNIQPAKVGKSTDEAVKFFKIRELKDTSYLEARGISKEIVNSQSFTGKIFNTIAYVDFESKKAWENNIAFPYFNSQAENPVGIEVKNAGLSRFLSGSVSINSLWPSNLPLSGKVDNLIFVESPINAPSMLQLAVDKHPDLEHLAGKDNLFLGSGGNYTNQKIAEIQLVIDKVRPNKLVFANDKGNAGVRFDFNILGQLERISNDPSKDDLKATLDLNQKNVRVTFTLNAINSDEAINRLSPIRDKFNNAFDKETYTTDLQPSGNNSAKLVVSYYNAYENNIFSLRVLEKEKGLENSIEILKPKGYDKEGKIMTDWNDVLMNVKGIDKGKLGRKDIEVTSLDRVELMKYFDTSKAGAKVLIADVKNELYNKKDLINTPNSSEKDSKTLKIDNPLITPPTYPQFVSKLHKEHTEQLTGALVPPTIERAFYSWQADEIKIFKDAITTQKLVLNPDQVKELNEIISNTNEKINTKIDLITTDYEKTTVNDIDTQSKIESLISSNGKESLEVLDTKVDNEIVHQYNNEQIDNTKDTEIKDNNFLKGFSNDQDQEVSM